MDAKQCWSHGHIVSSRGLLPVFVFKLCFSRALRRHCVTAIFVLFSFLLLHVCYVCTAVSQQANSALKVFPSFFFFFFGRVLLPLNIGALGIGSFYLSDMLLCIIPQTQN